MSKKITSIIFITVTGLLLILSFYSLISGGILNSDTRDTWTIDSYSEYTNTTVTNQLEVVRDTLKADDSLRSFMFDTKYTDVNQQEQKILEVLNLSNDEESYVSYSYKTDDLIDLKGALSILNVTGSGDYRFMLTPAIGQEPVDFKWVIEDLEGNVLYSTTTITTSIQDKISLGDGVYFIYSEIGRVEGQLSYKVTLNKY